MARPDPKVIAKVDTDILLWEITDSDKLYIITYNDKPVGVRTTKNGLLRLEHKYKKMSYQHLGNAKLTARRFNATFNTTAFAVLDVFANVIHKDLK